jgi:protein-disulfide isomerase
MRFAAKAIIAASMLCSTAATAQEARLSAEDKKEIVSSVVEYFRANPEELMQALVESRRKKLEEEQAKKEDIFAAAAAEPWYGAVDAPITVITFTDYGCKPCAKAELDIARVVAERPEVKVVHRDYPVSGDDAVAASLDLITAFNRKGYDWKKLKAGLIAGGVGPENRVKSMQEAGGVLEMPAEPQKLALLKNSELASKAGVKTLPAVIVVKGGKVVPISGDVTYETVTQAVAALSTVK